MNAPTDAEDFWVVLSDLAWIEGGFLGNKDAALVRITGGEWLSSDHLYVIDEAEPCGTLAELGQVSVEEALRQIRAMQAAYALGIERGRWEIQRKIRNALAIIDDRS